MASKSKKRRRVLGASCILAALIIAGSSFAWFTSKDEVTNRLTANADYGVSIVESFAPPKNWLPGQEINKDVYAVNTGNVDAYVKEKITGVLNYTYEQVIDTLDKDCVQLTPERITAIDGATTEEAGGYLAWTDAKVEGAAYPTGPVNSARKADANDASNTINDNKPGVTPNRWTPPATGAYIFRRKIDTTSAGNSMDNPSFTYAGYYFVKAGDKIGDEVEESADDRYFEIVIGNDTHPTDGNDSVVDRAAPFAKWNFDVNVASNKLGNDVTTGEAITVNKDGDISGTPKIRYVKEYKVENKAAEFVYDKGNNDTNKPATLTVQYSPEQTEASSDNVKAAKDALDEAKAALEALTGTGENEKSDATRSKEAALAEKAYEDALGAYNTALSRYNQTLADFELAKDVAAATNALYDAADARAVFQAKLNDAKDAKDDAWNDAEGTSPATASSVVGKAAAMVDETTSGAYKDVISMKSDGSAVSFASLFGNADNTYSTDQNNLVGRINHLATTYANSTDPNASRFTSMKENMDRMHGLWDEIKGLLNDKPNGTNLPIPGIVTDLKTLANDASEGMAPDDLNKIESRLTANIAALKEKMTAYNEAWTAFKRAADNVTAQLTGIDLNGADVATTKDTTDGFYNAYFTENTGLKDLIEDYKTKYNTWYDMNDDNSTPPKPNSLGQAKKDWSDAVNKYNGDIDAAKTKYDNAINTIQPELNNYYRLNGTEKSRKLTDQSAFILNDSSKTYVAEGAGTNGKFADEPAYTTFTGTVTVDSSTTPPTYTAGSKPDKPTPTATSFEQLDTSDETNKKEDVNGTGADFRVFKLEDLETAKDTAFKAVYGDTGTVETPAANSKADEYAKAKKLIDDITKARAAVTAAQAAYNNAVNVNSPVKIIVQLADDENDLMWQYDTVNTGTNGTEANFYYKKVLGAGETSEKLIDSVYLDKDVPSTAYKTLVFDLNVGLDSIQVTYDADQRNYSTEAVNAADDTFKLDVTNEAPITKDTKLTWG